MQRCLDRFVPQRGCMSKKALSQVSSVSLTVADKWKEKHARLGINLRSDLSEVRKIVRNNWLA